MWYLQLFLVILIEMRIDRYDFQNTSEELCRNVNGIRKNKVKSVLIMNYESKTNADKNVARDKWWSDRVEHRDKVDVFMGATSHRWHTQWQSF